MFEMPLGVFCTVKINRFVTSGNASVDAAPTADARCGYIPLGKLNATIKTIQVNTHMITGMTFKCDM